MAMLAEVKSKQKWSDDPRNTKWSRDKKRYGYQMLEKMGWSKGKGLGKDKAGTTFHVKVKKRKTNLGLGAKESHDNDWMAQQVDFNNLLSALQQHGGNTELRTVEENRKAMSEVAKASKKRVFYKRFIRSKDTSQYSQNDMACILGSVQDSALSVALTTCEKEEGHMPERNPSISNTNLESDSGIVTYTSKQNIQEYFAQRMRNLKAANMAVEEELNDNAGTSVEHNEIDKVCREKKLEESVEDVLPKMTKKRKKKKEKDLMKNHEISDEQIINGNDDSTQKKSVKKHKKKKARREGEIDQNERMISLVNESKGKVFPCNGSNLLGANSERNKSEGTFHSKVTHANIDVEDKGQRKKRKRLKNMKGE
ncbi:PIN2/TERF1-interacting telomerase inhibitor 1-like [Xenia sp. Carnegie-2017]|uniref:PIN2/TERF1-interacting telomerase inhibitor 1-like n=1 Tax=Xenia sp. Carnegie-2017 TaxID=2897299 RepID=UPI001F03C7BD|nr:PIN2/TERF1-interacting telomerase inhibitor 1-like [Xenia sp. Carnegie-2017]